MQIIPCVLGKSYKILKLDFFYQAQSVVSLEGRLGEVYPGIYPMRLREQLSAMELTPVWNGGGTRKPGKESYWLDKLTVCNLQLGARYITLTGSRGLRRW